MNTMVGVDTRVLMLYDANKKSMGTSYVLWFFLGGLSAHRFYHGKTGSAVVQLLISIFGWLTIGLAGLGLLLLIPLVIWLLIDAFLIPTWVRNHNNFLIEGFNALAASPGKQNPPSEVQLGAGLAPSNT